MMKQYNYFWIFVLALATSTSWAYGGGSSSSKACAKPTFTDFSPAENAEVAVGSGFSFTASANTHPESVKVSVKGLPANIKVSPKNGGSMFEVSGTLPPSLKGTYARIVIEADAQSNCKGGGGWLVKIKE
jgi:hypothetical protein